MAVQGSLFPFSSPANVLLTLERCHRRVEALREDWSPQHCLGQLSDLALFEALLDKQEHAIRHSAKLQHQRLGMLV